ncbi:SAM-dependent methyltransferase [Micromonospora terminaliae]|uniref:S-adenosyl-L-methionine-dependent methyltransferase n=1 Tax=Micromonospora terminaliae TaxID=1914461 RepID=A0AAJ3DJ19_9ACTN|nr:class I SAM-dependent methyltransferase [Micromonospora terminaliae]NES27798.1 class I SAM-dependent methyltransferase [Micromonospora terminaliae]QGL47420.1 SAM-dependent methyltransferase [Micromonospora terminaliae]
MPGMLASRTAVLVCQGRAAADGLVAAGRFADPTALPLLRADEREVVQQVRDGVPPPGWRQRVDFETVRASAELMAPRTIAIDDAVRAHPCPQLVILGAGLDGRAWRMPELAEVTVFEADRPASQRDKRDRAAALPGTPPRFVPVDFGRDPLAGTLAAHGHHADLATTWIWEGVVPYLTRAEVTATVAAVAACSAPGSRLVVNFQSPATSARLGRIAARLLTASTGRPSVWADEPWRSTWTPAAMAALLTRHGFTVTAGENLLDTARRLALPVRHARSLRHGQIMVADRA